MLITSTGIRFKRSQVLCRRCYSLYTAKNESTSKQSQPLRILFCGSDDFSSASLRALKNEQQRNPQAIASIDVLCRPGKPTGRSLKTIREVPIKAVAQRMGLPVHERDTFTGWNLPKPNGIPINLIIAVSFGLFVPPRILNSTEYGGLNLHPSMLPDLRGPAPLQHTILQGRKYTGITLQTLDDKAFDNGVILAQTDPPGYAIPSSDDITYPQLLEFVSSKAPAMLVEGIRNKLYVKPFKDVGPPSNVRKSNLSQGLYQPAPKTTPANRQIGIRPWDPIEIDRQFRALGRLWSYISAGGGSVKRLLFEDFEKLRVDQMGEGPALSLSRDLENGMGVHWLTLVSTASPKALDSKRDLQAIPYIEDGHSIIIGKPNLPVEAGDSEKLVKASSHMFLRVSEVTLEGQGKKSASMVKRSIRAASSHFKDKGS